jgi:hypothetical protein
MLGAVRSSASTSGAFDCAEGGSMAAMPVFRSFTVKTLTFPARARGGSMGL